MKVLTVRQPYAWMLIHAGKDIENRGYRTKHRGPLLIQSSCQTPRKYFDEAIQMARERGIEVPFDQLQYGGSIGIVDVTGCVAHSDSKWFFGPVGWTLVNPRPVEFIRFSGMQMMFDAPQFVVDQLKL